MTRGLQIRISSLICSIFHEFEAPDFDATSVDVFGIVDGVVILASFTFAFLDEELVVLMLVSFSLFLSLLFDLFFLALVDELSSLWLSDDLPACTTFETPKKKKYEANPAAIYRKDSA